MTYFAPIYARAGLDFVESVTARVVEPDVRLMALLAKPSPLSAEEWAYLEMVERDAE